MSQICPRKRAKKGERGWASVAGSACLRPQMIQQSGSGRADEIRSRKIKYGTGSSGRNEQFNCQRLNGFLGSLEIIDAMPRKGLLCGKKMGEEWSSFM